MASKRKTLNIKGSKLWYLIGLITSDGSLSKDGRHIDITSKNGDFLCKLVKKLSLDIKVTVKNKGTKKQAFRIQIANKHFYSFLKVIGLMPRKSLKLSSINVPEAYFSDFLRGLIDGDGCIRKWVHPANGQEQWSLRIYSGSFIFIKWLRYKIGLFFDVEGKVYREEKSNLCTLKYGKMAAREILKKCYYQGCFGLQRKVALARNCVVSYRGWGKSKTAPFAVNG